MYRSLNRKVKSGHIILLNGVSSSGKSAIATELQKILESPYWIMPLDNFLNSFSYKRVKWFYKSVAVFASEGNNVIVDTVVDKGIHEFQYVQKILRKYHVDYIGIRCSLDELKRREMERSDRRRGLAETQFLRVHCGINYKFEVDSTDQSPLKCAELIGEYLRGQV